MLFRSLFMQMIKNLEISKALPGPPNSGPHQSPTSALPVNAWQITMALSLFGDNSPFVLYARGTLRRVTPDSRVNEGIMAMFWSGINSENGFSGCFCVLSWTYSVAILWTKVTRERTDKTSMRTGLTVMRHADTVQTIDLLSRVHGDSREYI